MASGRLLVVAPDNGIRESLVFSLEADGFEITARDQLPNLAWMQQRRFDCTVLDQSALDGQAYESIAFCIKAHPVVLMAGRPHSWLTEWVSQVVVTPLTDNALNTAIRLAIQIQS